MKALLKWARMLVPSDVRRDWEREWAAELDVAAQQGRGRTERSTRAMGAFVHAAWLRWDRWRLEMLLQDLKYALRTLTKRPGFAVITILTLAIGIGANAAIFSAVRAVVLRPLPFPDSEQLVQISSTTTRRPEGYGGTASPPDFVDWRSHTTRFAEIAAINAGQIAWSGHGAAEQVPFAYVTDGFFDVLRVPALLGRTLEAGDETTGTSDVVVISHNIWSRRFGADPGVLDRPMILDGTPRRIVGVMPRGFAFPIGSELWLPLRFTPDDLATQRGAHYLDVIGRLEPDATLEQARSEMSAIVDRLARAHPRTNANKRVAVYALRDAVVGDARPAMLMLLGAVGFVLLIVCVNVTSLALTRAVGRTRELAVRAALGASRGRLIKGLLAESLMLALSGGALGLLLAAWASQGIASLDRGVGIPLLDQTRIDSTVVAFTAGISLVCAVFFGTLPAWHASARLDIAKRIREDAGASTGRERQKLRAALIVAETAFAVVLLVGAGLLMRSFISMISVDLGFDTSRVQTFSLSLPEAKYATPASRAAFVETLLERLGARPETEAAGAVFGLPLTNFGYTISTSTLDGRRLTDEEQDARSVQIRVVTPDYFRALRIPVIRGRGIQADDRLGTPPVAVINEAAAELLWPGESPLGHHFALGTRLGQGGERAGGLVVGVTRNLREFGPAGPIRPIVYLSHGQFPMDFMAVAINTRGEPAAIMEVARGIVADLDPDVPLFRVRTMEQFAANAVAQPRLYLTLIALFAATAVLLAAIGIYGVLMHGVTQRTKEIGIRLALGARRTEVVSMVVRQAAALTLAGLVAGLVLAFGASQLIGRLLVGVEPNDAVTYGAVAMTLFGVALLASYLPARRAAQTDPIRALRFD